MADTPVSVHERGLGFSRRGFIKGALAGAGLFSLSMREAAAQMLAGPSARPVRGWGVEQGLVKLSGNENAIGPSPKAVEAILQHIYGINRYGRSPDLFEKLCKLHDVPVIPSDPLGFSTPDNAWVTISAGSSEILFAIASAYLRNGGETVEAVPGYGDISRRGESFGSKAIWVPLTKDFQQDIPAMLKAVNKNTKMVIITNPGNPTGQLVTADEMKKLVASVPPTVIVVFDEAYIHFAKDESVHGGAAPLVKQYPNVIVTRTFSKIYGMAGMRVGYGVAQPSVIQKLNQNKGGAVSVLSSYAASAAVDDLDYQRRSREAVIAGKEYFYKELKAMGLEFVPNSESSFIIVNVKKNSDEVVKQLETQYKVLVANAFQRWKLQGWLRVTAGLPEENEMFIQALKKVLQPTSS